MVSTQAFIFLYDGVYYSSGKKKSVFIMELDSEMSLSCCISGCYQCSEAAALKNSGTERFKSRKSVHERNMPPSSPLPSFSVSSAHLSPLYMLWEVLVLLVRLWM